MAEPVKATSPLRAQHALPSALGRWLIRVRAYFRKEVNELRRQPLLILSLVGGPLLVLVLFGTTFQNSTPKLRTVIVLPSGGVPGVSAEQIRRLAGTNFTIVDVTADRAAAEALLREGELDVVQLLPAEIFAAVQRGETPTISFLSNALDPMSEGWVQYLAYAEVNEINKALLRQQAADAQSQAVTVTVQLQDVRALLGRLEGTLSELDQERAQQQLRSLATALTVLEQRLPQGGVLADGQTEVDSLRSNIARIKRSIETLDNAIATGKLSERIDDLRATDRDLGTLEGAINIFVKLSPDVIVAPLRQEYSNIRGAAYPAVIYYAPGVVALLVQHTAITLGALALVRERLLGAFEVFRVAPVQMTQLLIGKYLGYTLVIGLTSALLIGTLRLIGLPLLGSLWQLLALLLLLTLASLGLGFLISTVSGSDSQAIQLAMITLLVAIFFSGLFITPDSFSWPARWFSAIVPMTHGVVGFRDLMLRGVSPDPPVWLGLAGIAIVSFILVVVLTRRQFQNA